MDLEKGLVKGDSACRYGYLYQGIIGEGKIIFIKDKKRKIICIWQDYAAPDRVRRRFYFR